MVSLDTRTSKSSGGLSGTALAAILTGVGVLLLGLLIVLVALLVRAVRTHRRLLADLEERGVVIAQARSRADESASTVTKPRAVLRRSIILPFNAKSGWGTLPSVETIAQSEPASIPPHATHSNDEEESPRSNHRSWPFSSRKSPKKAFQLKKIRVPQLSTVIESPKPSPLVPILGTTPGESSSQNQNKGRPLSDQSMLRHHPALRNDWPEVQMDNPTTIQTEPLRRSLTAKPTTSITERRIRPNRSKSVPEVRTTNEFRSCVQRARLHTRSASMCSQSSGHAPDAPMPPLPLEIARIKSEARRRSLLSRSPSRSSVSSFESAGSSILVTQSSPIMSRPNNVRVQKVAHREWRNSMIIGPRPLRDTMILHGKNQQSMSSIKSGIARYSTSTPTKRKSDIEKDSSITSLYFRATDPRMSPSRNPLTVRSMATPRRQSNSHVTSYGSPQERRRASVLRDVSGNKGSPRRQLSQLSQASTAASSPRSNTTNPFEFDPMPLLSGKPSALKGSPGARKGHKRQNCVRISLAAPTILGPPSRSSTPSVMKDIQEESPDMTAQMKATSYGLSFSPAGLLPSPSAFASDVKLNPTSVRASLTPSSPTLPLADLKESPKFGHSNDNTFCFDFEPMRNRYSNTSALSIPSFPSPCHEDGSVRGIVSPPPVFHLSRPRNSSTDEIRTLGSPVAPSSPFDPVIMELPPVSHSDVAEYDPHHPLLGYQELQSSPPRNFSSYYEDSSVSPVRSESYGKPSFESPPCSPKTCRPRSFLPVSPDRVPTRASHTSNNTNRNRKESLLDFIDPAILSDDMFDTSNKECSNPNIVNSSQLETWNDIQLPSCPTDARNRFQPLIEAAFSTRSQDIQCKLSEKTMNSSLGLPGQHPPRPNSPLNMATSDTHSSSSSVYSASSTLAVMPCSPRPQHATLPSPMENVPSLHPSQPIHHLLQSQTYPLVPRTSPPHDLRCAVLDLRRSNSDAEKGGKSEQRYLNLGRENDIDVPGEESWMEGLDDPTGIEDYSIEWNEEEQRRLVGDVLDDWEAEADRTISQAEEEQSLLAPPTFQKSQSQEIDDQDLSAQDKQRESSSSKRKETSEVSNSVFVPTAQEARSSSIWEDGEKFWQSTPPRPISGALTVLNSPIIASTKKTPTLPITTPSTPRKRAFEVAKDTSPATPSSSPENEFSKQEEARKKVNKYRKRHVMGMNAGIGIQIQPPSSSPAPAVQGTPGSLYDADGFLRA